MVFQSIPSLKVWDSDWIHNYPQRFDRREFIGLIRAEMKKRATKAAAKAAAEAAEVAAAAAREAGEALLNKERGVEVARKKKPAKVTWTQSETALISTFDRSHKLRL